MTIFPRPRERSCGMEKTPVGPFEIRSEARGPHWVAWLAGPGESRPHQSVLLVGATRAEAEEKAREWAARLAEPGGDQATWMASSSKSS